MARMLFPLMPGALLIILLSAPHAGTTGQQTNPTELEKVVFLGGDLSPENLLIFTTAIAASGHPGVVLLDSKPASPYIKAFLSAYKPEYICPVGSFPEGREELERRLGAKTKPILTWTHGPPRALWRKLFPKAERVVVCPAEPRGLLLQSACLAGVLGAPLFVVHGKRGESDELRRWMDTWKVQRVYAVGGAAKILPRKPVAPASGERAFSSPLSPEYGGQGSNCHSLQTVPRRRRRACYAPWR